MPNEFATSLADFENACDIPEDMPKDIFCAGLCEFDAFFKDFLAHHKLNIYPSWRKKR